jgi:CTP:molybdopterin cytidylyltransferase MocA
MMTSEKIVAVVLAGGSKKFSFKELWHQLEDLFTYKEWYFRRGYKSLKKIKGMRGVGGKPKPMVEYILDTLRNTEEIDRILVVGPEKEMREKIDPEFLSGDSNIKLIDQKESFGHNVKEGYDHAGEKHVLFVTSDSPTTKEEDVSEFIGICRELSNDYGWICPIVKESLLKRYYRLFPRPFFKMVPDNIFPDDYIDKKEVREDGRVGFRITSMAFVNLENIPGERIDEAYNIRKLYRKCSRDTLKTIFGKKVIRRYRQGLKMSELEKMISDYEGLRLKFVGLSGAGTSLDLDSRRDEKKFNKLRL